MPNNDNNNSDTWVKVVVVAGASGCTFCSPPPFISTFMPEKNTLFFYCHKKQPRKNEDITGTTQTTVYHET